MSDNKSDNLSKVIGAVVIFVAIIGAYHYSDCLPETTNTTRNTPTTHVQTQREYTLRNSFITTSQEEAAVLNDLLLSGNRQYLFEYINTHSTARFIYDEVRIVVVERVGGLTGPEYVRIQLNGQLYWTIPESLRVIQ